MKPTGTPWALRKPGIWDAARAHRVELTLRPSPPLATRPRPGAGEVDDREGNAGNLARQRALMGRICGTDGGLMNWKSSPLVMWLGLQLDNLGDLAIAVVADDREAAR